MIRKIILGLIILGVLIIAYNLITQTMTAMKSGERLSQAAEVVYKLENKNKVLKSKLSLVGTQQFIEEEIRNRLGLTKAGETLIIIPEEKLKLVMGSSFSAQIRLPNPLGWLKVFFK